MVITAEECRLKQQWLDKTESFAAQEILKNVDSAIRDLLHRHIKTINVFIPVMVKGCPAYDRSVVETRVREELAAANYHFLPSTSGAAHSFDISWE